MNFAQIIQSLEQLIYEIAIWAIFAPKTFLKVVTNPKWIWRYISSEITKDPSEQFDEYQSPILFWLIIGVLPFILVYRDVFASFGIATFEVMAGLTVLLILIPQIIFTLVLQRSCKKPFTRTSIKPAFYAQCLCFAPLLLSYTLIGASSRTIFPSITLYILVPLSLAWFMITEISVFKLASNWSWRKAFLTVLAVGIACFSLLLLALQTNLLVRILYNVR